jgi:hypothetical protein
MGKRNLSLLFAVIALLVFTVTVSDGASLSLRQTGQQKCYDSSGAVISCSGSGQDGEYQEGVAWTSDGRFTVDGDCVTDNITGLMWAKDANMFGSSLWATALSDANGLTLCGYSDWRLPNVVELQSLAHSGYNGETCDSSACARLSDWLKAQGFTNVQAAFYWSSTALASNNLYAWTLNFWRGNSGYNDKNYGYYYVWPVRAGQTDASAELWQTGLTACYDNYGKSTACLNTGQDGDLRMGIAWPNPRFTESATGVVTDNLTGLVWLKDANCLATHYPDLETNVYGYVHWQTALDFIKGINSGAYQDCGAGFADWSLPNIEELFSLIDFGQHNPALPPGHPFTNVQASSYWSSTTNANGTANAWVVNFQEGDAQYNGSKSGNNWYVWPVRCGNKAVGLGAGAPAYDDIMSAYNDSDSTSGRTISARALSLNESLVLASGKTITLTGGFNCIFSANIRYTTINSLTIGGTDQLIISNILIK